MLNRMLNIDVALTVHRKLALCWLLLFAVDMGSHTLSLPIHHEQHTCHHNIAFDEPNHSSHSDNHQPCGTPGHCCGLGHHSHVVALLSAIDLSIGANLLSLTEWAQQAAYSHSIAAVRSIRAPPFL